MRVTRRATPPCGSFSREWVWRARLGLTGSFSNLRWERGCCGEILVEITLPIITFSILQQVATLECRIMTYEGSLGAQSGSKRAAPEYFHKPEYGRGILGQTKKKLA